MLVGLGANEVRVRRVVPEQRSALPEHVDLDALRAGVVASHAAAQRLRQADVRQVMGGIDLDILDPAHVHSVLLGCPFALAADDGDGVAGRKLRGGAGDVESRSSLSGWRRAPTLCAGIAFHSTRAAIARDGLEGLRDPGSESGMLCARVADRNGDRLRRQRRQRRAPISSVKASAVPAATPGASW